MVGTLYWGQKTQLKVVQTTKAGGMIHATKNLRAAGVRQCCIWVLSDVTWTLLSQPLVLLPSLSVSCSGGLSLQK